MSNHKIPTAIAVTLGVWIAALGSAAAALTYDLNRPLHVSSTTVSSTTSPIEVASNPTRVVPAELLSEMQPVLFLPPVTIVGRYQPAVARVPKTFEDRSDPQCTDWRELQMGSGRVQLCE